ncbi:hypothetical protein CLM82_02805 [Streptomyces albidoflavus]|nr:hypothetical protein CLM82_02805 [Streptomyces albidoflavus]
MAGRRRRRRAPPGPASGPVPPGEDGRAAAPPGPDGRPPEQGQPQPGWAANDQTMQIALGGRKK